MSGASAVLRRSALNVPNLLSVMRLPMAAAFFLVESTAWRGVLLTIAALSDLLDGWLARMLRQESRAGVILDPLFDKLFVTTVLAAFLAGPRLDWPQFLVLLSRDLYVSLLFLVTRAMRFEIPLAARAPGKTVTALQIATMFVLLFWPDLATPFVVIVGLASLVAIIDYSAVGVAALRKSARAG